jgi:hypothetical protein
MSQANPIHVRALALQAGRPDLRYSDAVSLAAEEVRTGVLVPGAPPAVLDEPDTWATLTEDRDRLNRVVRSLSVELGVDYLTALERLQAWFADAGRFSAEPATLAKALKLAGLSVTALESRAIQLKIGSTLPGASEAIRLAREAREQAREEDVDDLGRVRFGPEGQDRRVAIVAGDELALTREYLQYRDTPADPGQHITGNLPARMVREDFEEQARSWAELGFDVVATFARQQRLAREEREAMEEGFAAARLEGEQRERRARELREQAELGAFLADRPTLGE